MHTNNNGVRYGYIVTHEQRGSNAIVVDPFGEQVDRSLVYAMGKDVLLMDGAPSHSLKIWVPKDPITGKLAMALYESADFTALVDALKASSTIKSIIYSDSGMH